MDQKKSKRLKWFQPQLVPSNVPPIKHSLDAILFWGVPNVKFLSIHFFVDILNRSKQTIMFYPRYQTFWNILFRFSFPISMSSLLELRNFVVSFSSPYLFDLFLLSYIWELHSMWVWCELLYSFYDYGQFSLNLFERNSNWAFSQYVKIIRSEESEESCHSINSFHSIYLHEKVTELSLKYVKFIPWKESTQKLLLNSYNLSDSREVEYFQALSRIRLLEL